MKDPRIQSRVDEDVADAVDDYADREQMNKSAAVRQFVVTGMDEFGELPEGTERPRAAPASNDNPEVTKRLLAGSERLLRVAAALAVLAAALTYFPLVPRSVGGPAALPLVGLSVVALGLSLSRLVVLLRHYRSVGYTYGEMVRLAAGRAGLSGASADATEGAEA